MTLGRHHGGRFDEFVEAGGDVLEVGRSCGRR